MKMAGGRSTDFLVTPDGRIVSGASLTVYLIANTPGVRQAQIIQDRKDAVLFRIVKGIDFSQKSIDFLLTTGREFLGGIIRIELEYVDEIKPSPSGKHLFCISQVNPFS